MVVALHASQFKCQHLVGALCMALTSLSMCAFDSLAQGQTQQCYCADASQWSQDRLFTTLTAATLVHRAAQHNESLARDVCNLLPKKAPGFAQLWSSIAGPPDIKNIALMTAVRDATGCKASIDVTDILWQASKGWAAAAAANSKAESGDANANWTPEALLQHDRRSVAFILASSSREPVLQWLATNVALQGGDAGMGLRSADQITLLETMALATDAGYKAAAAAMKDAAKQLPPPDPHPNSFAAGPDAALRQVLQATAWLAVPAATETLPDWADQNDLMSAEQLRHAQQRRAMEKTAAGLACA
jgi:hypothetical protein